MEKKSEATLSGIPGETITDITGYMDVPDIGDLRGVNKELSLKAKFAYAKRALTNLHVMLHPLSFEKLGRLADDPFYAAKIEHITISTYVLRDRGLRRKGTDDGPWDDEDAFILGPAAQCITTVLAKTRNLQSLTISEYDDMWSLEAAGLEYEPCWGVAKINRRVHFKRGESVNITKILEDDLVWHRRLKAFEAIVVGVANATLPATTKLRLNLNGNYPRILSPQAQSSCPPILSAAAHVAATLDFDREGEWSSQWLEKINPEILSLSYNMAAWHVPGETLNLQLGNYSQLRTVRITDAKTTNDVLVDFLTAHSGTLRIVELRGIFLLWTHSTQQHPWVKVFNTIMEMSDLQSLWLTTLAAVSSTHLSTNTDPRAYQEIAWKGETNIWRALSLLCDRYERQAVMDIWVNMDWLDEEMMSLYGWNG